MELFKFLYVNHLFHWLSALLGIFAFLLVRRLRVVNFRWKRWFNENLIGLLWSLFFLSLTVTLSAEYSASYTIMDAFLTSYCGSHVIFRLNKEPKILRSKLSRHRLRRMLQRKKQKAQE